ncbi:MAG: low specificity L-threonine aldolase [Bdellovibrionaceae bacterium]|nr:low specificity L-threonine aldolase [Pseudobdellovibrionaceae bacterium]
MRRGFGSDNHSGVHPRLLKAIELCNIDHAPSYGTDVVSERCLDIFRQHFGAQTSAYFVFNGSAANILALKTLVRPWQSVLCTDIAHIFVDECAGPEVVGGMKLWPIPSNIEGKLTVEALEENFIRRGDQHFAQAAAISITQPTELGTVYSLDELNAICSWAKSKKLYIHVDGARFAGACSYLGVSFKSLSTDLGVDVLSFGGTKNGFLFGEAVLILNPELDAPVRYIRKHMGQLPSKSRFIAAQFEAYLRDNLWKEIAEHTHKMALRLADSTRSIPGVSIRCPVQTNAVFATIPRPWIAPLRKEFFFYVWNEKTFESRWMCSWDTTEEDIDNFAKTLRRISDEIPPNELS